MERRHEHRAARESERAMTFDQGYWDDRYGTRNRVWGAAPNRWVERELADERPGRALDLACGEGRNAAWLAARGWQVVAVDFSRVALAKGAEAAPQVDWVCADVTDPTSYSAPDRDLALVCYLQLPADPRRAAIRGAAATLAPGGTLLVIGHDSRNLADGVGGPQDPAVLYTADDLVADVGGLGLEIVNAGEELRRVDDADRPAIDTLLRARRPTAD